MRRHLTHLALLATIFAMAGWATVIPFGSDLMNESNSVTGTNVIINAHPAWGSLPPYSWVSYADTGFPGTVRPPNTTTP